MSRRDRHHLRHSSFHDEAFSGCQAVSSLSALKQAPPATTRGSRQKPTPNKLLLRCYGVPKALWVVKPYSQRNGGRLHLTVRAERSRLLDRFASAADH